MYTYTAHPSHCQDKYIDTSNPYMYASAAHPSYCSSKDTGTRDGKRQTGAKD